MDFSKRQFPYPVLSDFSDDYSADRFTSELKFQEEGIKIKFYFSASLTNEDLQNLIQTGQASLVHYIECPATGFRKAFETSDMNFTTSVDSRNLSGKIETCSLITARKNIPSFSSSGFNPEYSGLTFDLETGCILAVAPGYSGFIDKTQEELEKSESIFSIIFEKDENKTEMSVDFESADKIIIKLPFSVFSSYKLLNKNSELAPLLNSITIVPALIFVLCSLEKEFEEGEGDYSDKRWFRHLNKVLTEKFHMELGNNQEFFTRNKVELAQGLAEAPLEEAFQYLLKDPDHEEGDDEE